MLHLGALLDHACARWPDRAALAGDGGAMIYGDLDRRAGAIAAMLRHLGLGADEPIIVQVSNHTSDLAAFLGVWRARGVVVPLHRTAVAATVDDALHRTAARFVVDGDADEPVQRLERAAPPPRAMLRDAALIVFTSGTTGLPKGVVLSHEAFARKLEAIDSILPFGEGTRTLLVLQLTFSFGQWVSLLTLARGGTLTIHEKFEPALVLETLATTPINRLGVVPTMLRAMRPLLTPALSARLREPPTARLFMAGGEPLPEALGRTFREHIPQLQLCDIYGLTETSTCDFVLGAEEQDRFPGTIGRPTPGVSFAILDETGHPVAPGSAGELVLKTPYIMRGYLDAPELTAAAFHDEWFRTGDLAELTSEGVVRLVGRRKELIVRGGNKISPIEVERVFLSHPKVAEALATGLPDPLLGEAIHLLVVPSPGALPKIEALRAWAAGRLDKYKIPDVVHLGTGIPLGRTGKADRAALKAQLLAKRD